MRRRHGKPTLNSKDRIRTSVVIPIMRHENEILHRSNVYFAAMRAVLGLTSLTIAAAASVGSQHALSVPGADSPKVDVSLFVMSRCPDAVSRWAV